MTMHEAIAATAAENPEAPAVTANGETLTYRQLDERANRLAHHLRALGVTRGRHVAVLLERSAEMIVALVSTLKAGAAYVPLDPLDPPARLEKIVRDARPACVVTSGHLARLLSDAEVRIVDIAAEWQAVDACPRTAPSVAADLDDVAYICFTSGSTGTPKGVRVAHRGVLRLATMADYSAADSFLQVAPLAFDASVFEIWCALLNGARLVLYPPQRPTQDGLARLIRDERITVALLATGLFHRMVDGPVESLENLRHLVFGGDLASPHHVNRAWRALPNVRLTNGYGVAEATCLSCYYDITEPLPPDRPVPIGRPLPGTRVYVLDDNGRTCDVGQPGELYVAGEGLALDYLGRPELTERRFVPEPLGPNGSARMYRTGDLVSMRDDGYLDFHGRLDTQVKIRGFRVEFGEIEAFLSTQPGVRQVVAVAGRHGPLAERQLIAYISTDVDAADNELVIARLRAVAYRELPHYLVPSTILVLDEIPVTGNGKIDRDALPPPPKRTARNMPEPYVPPRTSLESLLADLVSDTLGVSPVGVFDDFFALGGDSLDATDLAVEIQRTLELEAPVGMVFGSWTVARLAEALAGNAQPSVTGR